jgi:glutamyl-tRNA reductase
LDEKTVLLLGAGEMGELAARHLSERRVREILIANRTGEKAIEVAGPLGATAVPYEEIFQKLDQVDIVITSTAAADPIIHEGEVREVMRRRKNRPMFFIDIAVPRNVDPAVNQIENVYLYDIDHLQGIVEANRKQRDKEAKRAEEIIEQEVKGFLSYLDQMELSPTIRELSKKFDLIRKLELEKYLSKRPEIPSREREALEACTRAMVNKILHEPIILMKTEEAKDGAPKYSEILKKLFKLE